MKKFYLMFFNVVILAGMLAGCNDNGKTAEAGREETFDKDATTGILNGHEWVDLGLPSGTRWATCNVGASSPEEYGDYFAWGETATKSTYIKDNSTYSGNPTTLPSNVDAATANWGKGWRMPTDEDFDELLINCPTKWTTQNGIDGMKFTGPNGNSIFLPAAGELYVRGLDYAGSYGNYWSSSLCTVRTGNAWYLFFDSGGCNINFYGRGYGFTVRPVCQSQN